MIQIASTCEEDLNPENLALELFTGESNGTMDARVSSAIHQSTNEISTHARHGPARSGGGKKEIKQKSSYETESSLASWSKTLNICISMAKSLASADSRFSTTQDS